MVGVRHTCAWMPKGGNEGFHKDCAKKRPCSPVRLYVDAPRTATLLTSSSCRMDLAGSRRGQGQHGQVKLGGMSGHQMYSTLPVWQAYKGRVLTTRGSLSTGSSIGHLSQVYKGSGDPEVAAKASEASEARDWEKCAHKLLCQKPSLAVRAFVDAVEMPEVASCTVRLSQGHASLQDFIIDFSQRLIILGDGWWIMQGRCSRAYSVPKATLKRWPWENMVPRSMEAARGVAAWAALACWERWPP